MKTYTFPADLDSTGGFQTQIIFEGWQKAVSSIPLASGECGNETMTSSPMVGLFLPYPEQIGTAYRGLFDDVDGMDYFRNNITPSDTKLGYAGEVALAAAKGHAAAGVTQISRMANAVVAGNASAAMAQRSILNNKAGVEYKGAQLREHTFSWKLTPRSASEQRDVMSIVTAIKAAATPAKENLSPADVKGLIESGEDAKAQGQKDAAAAATDKEEKGMWDSLVEYGEDAVNWANENISTLTIPPTVKVEFLVDGTVNHSLFKIAPSFITAFEVNYTPNGHWQAHMDGTPMETTITITLKEIEAIYAQGIGAGY